MERLESLCAEYPQVSEALGPPELLHNCAPATLERLEAIERLRVEDPERFRRLKKELIGGVSLCLAGAALLGPQGHTSSDDPLLYVGAGLVGTGLSILLHRDLVLRRHGTPRSMQFLLAPNGCALAYRF